MVAVAAWAGAWVHREYPTPMPQQSMYHHILAVCVFVVSLAAFSMEFKIIELQGKLLDEVKTLADKMREERIASRIAEQSLSDPNQSIPADQREL
jgi:predicted Holliday junction resolvase-like endonuclease